jgi:hypothetical protein
MRRRIVFSDTRVCWAVSATVRRRGNFDGIVIRVLHWLNPKDLITTSLPGDGRDDFLEM